MTVCCDWCILISPLFYCSSEKLFSQQSAVVLFSFCCAYFYHVHPCFRNFNSTIPVDVIRVKSCVDSFLDPTCVQVRVSINKLNMPMWLATIWFGTRKSLLIEILTDFTLITSTGIMELKFLMDAHDKKNTMPDNSTTADHWGNSYSPQQCTNGKDWNAPITANLRDKWCHVISWPHYLKKTSSKQLKHPNLHMHLKRLHPETNDNTLN